ncbi:hypothetical protein M9H77_30430 [Catharanthus roseus]|uniref:Uncharacterized protein n=1 Tax=Catharanthus roseus TaxID=4058 RepID=A0ACC0A1H7_CATRO|nr:hypothetical protein M9H77_30430 [Catharanthus roseus]
MELFGYNDKGILPNLVREFYTNMFFKSNPYKSGITTTVKGVRIHLDRAILVRILSILNKVPFIFYECASTSIFEDPTWVYSEAHGKVWCSDIGHRKEDCKIQRFRGYLEGSGPDDSITRGDEKAEEAAEEVEDSDEDNFWVAVINQLEHSNAIGTPPREHPKSTSKSGRDDLAPTRHAQLLLYALFIRYAI